VKILFCCHYAKIHDYYCDISHWMHGHDTEVIDLPAIENSNRRPKHEGNIPWRALWQVSQTIARGRSARRGRFYLRRHWRYLPISAIQKSLHLYKAYSATLRELSPNAVCVWGGKYRSLLLSMAARDQKIAVVYMENGVLPFSTAVDLHGINADNSLPRDPDFYRALPAAPAGDSKPSLEVRTVIPGKHGNSAGLEVLPERYIFVPFQVDSDTQILVQSPWIRNMRHYYRLVVSSFKQLDDPQLHLIFKEHPSSESSYPDLHRKAAGETHIHFVNNRRTQELIEHAESVVTINSAVGIESLLFDRPVIVTGRAFYNIPDLVLSAESATGLLQALRTIRTFRTDQQLRRNFLHYLGKEYLVPGKKFSQVESHLQAMATRITQLLENQTA
jgi:capsular polysaccharide export protein